MKQCNYAFNSSDYEAFLRRVNNDDSKEILLKTLLDYIKPGTYKVEQMSSLGPDFNDPFSVKKIKNCFNVNRNNCQKNQEN